jgi:hypothetical protein
VVPITDDEVILVTVWVMSFLKPSDSSNWRLTRPMEA